MKLEPGSVVLAPGEVAKLRELLTRWKDYNPMAIIELGETVRDLLTQASDDERKPVVR